MKKWLKRLSAGLLALLVCVVVVGTAWEALARSKATRSFPAPGRLVDIGGGRRIQLDCRGAGSPVVVFESGLDRYGSLSWAAVHDSIALTTRACAYSRAGIMWSDAARRPFSSAHVAEDLRAALAAGGEKGPYVLVAHSLGGPYALTYTGRYGSDVAGLVFVDASHPDQVARMRAATGKDMKPAVGMASVAASFAWTGLVRALIPSGRVPNAPVWIYGPANARFATSLGPVLEEANALDATLAAAGASRQLGDRPLVVLTANEKMRPEMLKGMGLTADQGEGLRATWLRMHDDEATWSTHSRHQIVDDASHYIQFDRPQVVIAAVRDVIAQVRKG